MITKKAFTLVVLTSAIGIEKITALLSRYDLIWEKYQSKLYCIEPNAVGLMDILFKDSAIIGPVNVKNVQEYNVVDLLGEFRDSRIEYEEVDVNVATLEEKERGQNWHTEFQLQEETWYQPIPSYSRSDEDEEDY